MAQQRNKKPLSDSFWDGMAWTAVIIAVSTGVVIWLSGLVT